MIPVSGKARQSVAQQDKGSTGQDRTTVSGQNVASLSNAGVDACMHACSTSAELFLRLETWNEM